VRLLYDMHAHALACTNSIITAKKLLYWKLILY